jgi:thymidine kinase
MSTGKIELILGPMFSGKTSELFRRLKRYKIAHKKCALIRYSRDNRYSSDKLFNHDKETLIIDLFSISSFIDEEPDLISYDVIGIDEGQFIIDTPSFSDRMANQGKIIIISALDGDFKRKGFGKFLNEIVPLCEEVIKLNSICHICQSEMGAFTQRTTDDQEIEKIGGLEMYKSTCRRCHGKK